MTSVAEKLAVALGSLSREADVCGIPERLRNGSQAFFLIMRFDVMPRVSRALRRIWKSSIHRYHTDVGNHGEQLRRSGEIVANLT